MRVLPPEYHQTEQLLYTNSHTNNINTLKKRPSSQSIAFLTDFAYSHSEDLFHLLGWERHYSYYAKIYALAALARSGRSYFKFADVFNRNISDIIQLCDFANIFATSNLNGRIDGHIKSIIRDRLGDLDEEDIALYYSKWDLSWEISLSSLIEISRPKFKNQYISQALDWLNNQPFDKISFRNNFAQLTTVGNIAGEYNVDNIPERLKGFKGDWRAILSLISEIDLDLIAPLLEMMNDNDFHKTINNLHFIISPGSQLPRELSDVIIKGMGSVDISRGIPESIILFPELWPILIQSYSKYRNKKNNSVVFIDVSGTNIISYEQDSSSLLNSIFDFCKLIRLQSEDVYIFNHNSKKLNLFDNTAETIKEVLSIERYLAGDPSLPFKKIISDKLKYSDIFIFTNYAFDSSTINLWKDYRRNITRGTRVFLIQYDPFNMNDLPLPEGYCRILGWNGSAVSIIQKIIDYL